MVGGIRCRSTCVLTLQRALLRWGGGGGAKDGGYIRFIPFTHRVQNVHSFYLLQVPLALEFLRIDNSGWSVNSSTLLDVAGMSWFQRKYHVLYIIRQPIIDSIY